MLAKSLRSNGILRLQSFQKGLVQYLHFILDYDSLNLFISGSNLRSSKFNHPINLVIYFLIKHMRHNIMHPMGTLFFRDMGLDLFRTIILNEKVVESGIVKGLLMLIDSERMGEQVDRSLLKNLLRMLSSLQVFPVSYSITESMIEELKCFCQTTLILFSDLSASFREKIS